MHRPSNTTLTISVGLLACFIFFKWEWAAWTALSVTLLGVFSPYLSRKVERAWMGLGYLLSLIVPNILLTVIFFLFLTPIALLSRLVGKKDPLLLRNTRKSTFEEVNRSFEPDSFEKTW
ncbi:MAG: hypothetical protein IPL49_11915 [Saprospirales bacterium]|nr:hypothetical protein [Saprospirales bacterium]